MFLLMVGGWVGGWVGIYMGVMGEGGWVGGGGGGCGPSALLPPEATERAPPCLKESAGRSWVMT